VIDSKSKHKSNKLQDFYANIKTNWRFSTKEGEYLGYREILSYSFAGGGINGLMLLISYTSLYSSTILIGSIYQISARVLYIMLVGITIISLVKTPIISLIMDNTGKKKGKFKPFLLWLGVPSVVFISLVPFVPLSWIEITAFTLFNESFSRAAVTIFILQVLISFTYPVTLVAYTGLGQTITPNTIERGKLFSFQPIIGNFYNSVVQVIFPILSILTIQNATTGLESILSYRVFFPIFGILGYLQLLIAYFNVEERIVVEKKYKPKIKFWHGVKSLSSNKYFWIITIGSSLNGVRASINIVPWICIYALKSELSLSISLFLLGTIMVPGMGLTGIFVRKFGKRTLMLTSGFVTTFLYIPLILLPQYPILLLITILFQNMVLGFATCAAIMPADALDYQQLKTGERLEGFWGNFQQLISSIILLIMGVIIPIILVASGMVGGADILAIDSIRYNVFRNISLFNMIMMFLSTIPYLFWNLSEEKHHVIIRELENIAIEKNHEFDSV
jgi:glycoside/pentoside/hexuronide:cation symporter, GPH family